MGGDKRDAGQKWLLSKGNGWWYGEKSPHPAEWPNLPSALFHIPIHVKDQTERFMAKAIAGSVGDTVRDSEGVSSPQNGVLRRIQAFQATRWL